MASALRLLYEKRRLKVKALKEDFDLREGIRVYDFQIFHCDGSCVKCVDNAIVTVFDLRLNSLAHSDSDYWTLAR